MSDSYKVYASEEYVDQRVPPSPDGTHKMLVTDADGKQVWEDRTHYETGRILTFDGNIENAETMVVDSMTFVKIGDALDGVAGTTVHVQGWEELNTPLPATLAIQEDWVHQNNEVFPGCDVVYPDPNVPIPIVVNDPTNGLYVLYVPAGFTIGEVVLESAIYIDRVECLKVKPLDPKFVQRGDTLKAVPSETILVTNETNYPDNGRLDIDIVLPDTMLKEGEQLKLRVVPTGIITTMAGTPAKKIYTAAAEQFAIATCGNIMHTSSGEQYPFALQAGIPLLNDPDGDVHCSINSAAYFLDGVLRLYFTGGIPTKELATDNFSFSIYMQTEKAEIAYRNIPLWSETTDSTKRFELAVDDNASASLTDVETGTKTKLLNETEAAALIDTKLEAAHPTELITIPASAWTGTEAPYFAMNQACSIATMTNTLSVSLSPTLTNPDDGMAEILSASTYNAIAEARIMAVVQADGGITFAAYGKKPEIDIPVIVTEVG